MDNGGSLEASEAIEEYRGLKSAESNQSITFLQIINKRRTDILETVMRNCNEFQFPINDEVVRKAKNKNSYESLALLLPQSSSIPTINK